MEIDFVALAIRVKEISRRLTLREERNAAVAIASSRNSRENDPLYLPSSFMASGSIYDNDHRHTARNVHGIVCALSWGILIPLVIRWSGFVARLQIQGKHRKLFHAVSIVAYTLGFGGTVVGLWLAGDAGEIGNKAHFSIAIALAVLGALGVIGFQCQCCCPVDGVAWAVIIMGIVNVFKGFDILDPPRGYRIGYTVVISLGCAAGLVAEILMCVLRPHQSGYFHHQESATISYV